MRSTATPSHVGTIAGLPRGWAMVGMALASWIVLAGLWVGLSQLFGLITATL